MSSSTVPRCRSSSVAASASRSSRLFGVFHPLLIRLQDPQPRLEPDQVSWLPSFRPSSAGFDLRDDLLEQGDRLLTHPVGRSRRRGRLPPGTRVRWSRQMPRNSRPRAASVPVGSPAASGARFPPRSNCPSASPRSNPARPGPFVVSPFLGADRFLFGDLFEQVAAELGEVRRRVSMNRRAGGEPPWTWNWTRPSPR